MLLRFVIANYFAVSDLSVIWNAFQCDEEACVGYWNVTNALKQTPNSLPKPRDQSGWRQGSFIRAAYSISLPVVGWMTEWAWCR
jgi:hypothetical protein